ncbi:MAG TPA: protein YgfX [Lysobacter sp.]
MPTSQRSSRASAHCRLEWRPSRRLAAALVVLGVLSGLSLIACELVLAVSVPLALLAVGEGVRLARGELSRPARWLEIGSEGAATLDGQAITAVHVEWRGPLAFLRFHDADGRLRRLAWWPDTLPATARRELRLAVPVKAAAQKASSMAP